MKEMLEEMRAIGRKIGTSITVDEDFSPDERKVKQILRQKSAALKKSFPDIITKVFVRKREL